MEIHGMRGKTLESLRKKHDIALNCKNDEMTEKLFVIFKVLIITSFSSSNIFQVFWNMHVRGCLIYLFVPWFTSFANKKILWFKRLDFCFKPDFIVFFLPDQEFDAFSWILSENTLIFKRK